MASCQLARTIILSFTPTALAKASTLTVKSAAGVTATVALRGTTISPLTATGANGIAGEDPLQAAGTAFTAATTTANASCAYGARSITASTFKSETFTFTNASVETGLLSTGLGSTNVDQFKIITDTGVGASATASTGTCKVTVRFLPTSTGVESATLTGLWYAWRQRHGEPDRHGHPVVGSTDR